MIIEQCVRNRMPLPDAIKNAPELQLGLALYYEAFFDLSTCRRLGYGEGPIPWTAVEQWAHAYKLSDEQRVELWFYIREMDGAYLKFRADQMPK